MNALAENKPATLALAEDELISVLRNSLYPGAQDESIRLVLSYCRVANLDPMQKPVHIVPMWDSESRSKKDVIMPGIGLYRIQAARTGQFAGMSEPEFGPEISNKVGEQEISYPEWAKVTVKRALASGVIAEFTAVEYWIENYASKGGAQKSMAPNAMWTKRTRGQLAKCAAAQALRIAFPEIGAQPTAEEMEGKSYNAVATKVIAHAPIPDDLLQDARDAAMGGSESYAKFFQNTGKANRKLLAPEHENLKAAARCADTPQFMDVETKEVENEA